MQEREWVVFIEAGRPDVHWESDWVLAFLRRFSSVRVVRDRAALAGIVREGTRPVVIFCQPCTDELVSMITSADSPVRPIVITRPTRLWEILRTMEPEPGLLGVESVQIEGQLPRCFCIQVTEVLIEHCRRALRAPGRLSQDPLLLAAFRRTFENRPVTSVAELADSVKRSPRWVERAWSRHFPEGEPHPPLTRIVRAVLFLRCLRLWLAGLELWKCAKLLKVSEGVLRGCFEDFAGAIPSKVSLEELPERLRALEKEVFGWLLQA